MRDVHSVVIRLHVASCRPERLFASGQQGARIDSRRSIGRDSRVDAQENMTFENIDAPHARILCGRLMKSLIQSWIYLERLVFIASEQPWSSRETGSAAAL